MRCKKKTLKILKWFPLQEHRAFSQWGPPPVSPIQCQTKFGKLSLLAPSNGATSIKWQTVKQSTTTTIVLKIHWRASYALLLKSLRRASGSDTGSSSPLSSVGTSCKTFLSNFSMMSLSNTCRRTKGKKEDKCMREKGKKSDTSVSPRSRERRSEYTDAEKHDDKIDLKKKPQTICA